MADPMRIRAQARDGKVLYGVKEIKVTLGGCGG